MDGSCETGYVVVLSTHNREMQEELHSAQLFSNGALEKMSYCREISRVAVSCGPTVKIVDVANGQFNELHSDKLEFDNKCEVTCMAGRCKLISFDPWLERRLV